MRGAIVFQKGLVLVVLGVVEQFQTYRYCQSVSIAYRRRLRKGPCKIIVFLQRAGPSNLFTY